MLEEEDDLEGEESECSVVAPHFECQHDGVTGTLYLLSSRCLFATQVCEWECDYATIRALDSTPFALTIAATHTRCLATPDPEPALRAFLARWVNSDAFHRSTLVQEGRVQTQERAVGGWSDGWAELNAVALVVLAGGRDDRDGDGAEVVDVVPMCRVFKATWCQCNDLPTFEVTVVATNRVFVFRVPSQAEGYGWCERIREQMGRPWVVDCPSFPVLAHRPGAAIERHTVQVDFASCQVLLPSPMSPESVPFTSLRSVGRTGLEVEVCAGARGDDDVRTDVRVLYAATDVEARLVEETLQCALSPPLPPSLVQVLTPFEITMLQTYEHQRWFERRAELREPGYLSLFPSHHARSPSSVYRVADMAAVALEVDYKPALCLYCCGVALSIVLGFDNVEDRNHWHAAITTKWHPQRPFPQNLSLEDRHMPALVRAMKCPPSQAPYSAPQPVVLPAAPRRPRPPRAAGDDNADGEDRGGEGRAVDEEIARAAAAVPWGEGKEGGRKSKGSEVGSREEDNSPEVVGLRWNLEAGRGAVLGPPHKAPLASDTESSGMVSGGEQEEGVEM